MLKLQSKHDMRKQQRSSPSDTSVIRLIILMSPSNIIVKKLSPAEFKAIGLKVYRQGVPVFNPHDSTCYYPCDAMLAWY